MVKEGSVLEDARHKRLDDRRGLLILARGKFIYVICVGGTTNLFGENTPPPIEQMAAKFRQRVEEFYATVKFTTP